MGGNILKISLGDKLKNDILQNANIETQVNSTGVPSINQNNSA